jgi:CSLREA domain-containing protein
MSHQNRLRCFFSIYFLCFTFLLGGSISSIRAQEVAPTETPQASEESLPTETIEPSPTEAITEIIPTSTEALPSLEPTQTAIAEITDSPLPSTETPTEALASPTAPATSMPSTLPLLLKSTFDEGLPTELLLGEGWSLSPSGNAYALFSNVSDSRASLSYTNLANLDVRMRVYLPAGAFQLMLRDNAGGNYTVLLRSDNQIAVFKAGQVLEMSSIQATTDAWHSLSVSIIDTSISLSVDSQLIFSIVDSNPLPAGAIAWQGTALGEAGLLIDDLELYGTLQADPTIIPSPQADRQDSGVSLQSVQTYVVNTTSDAADINLGDSVCDSDSVTIGSQCSLRAAIQESNASIGDKDTIAFNISGAGVKTITPLSALPTITDPVIIDGYTQPGTSLATGISPATLLIELNGSSAGGSDWSPVDGLLITAGSTTVKGLVINRFFNSGIRLTGSSNSIITGNHIGTNAAGTSNLGNNFSAIAIFSSNNNIIGGLIAAERNLLSASKGGSAMGDLGYFQVDGAGLYIWGTATGNLVQGNYIGTDASGTLDLFNNGNGIVLYSSNNTAESNRIAFNKGVGILVGNGATGNRLTANSIFSSIGNAPFRPSSLGIDLDSNAYYQNDSADLDSGANNAQNYPILSSAVTNGGNIEISIRLHSSINTLFRLEFFANELCDPSGFGEGKTFLGFANLSTNVVGTVTTTVSVPLQAAEFITATATDPSGNTSEFSPCVELDGNSPTTVTNGNDTGYGSLNYAILVSNANLGFVDTIDFNFAGTGVHTISPTSELPIISDSVVIDGYTQTGAAPATAVNDAILMIELSGNNLSVHSRGLQITAGGTTVRGLAINRFGYSALELSNNGSNTIQGNYFGTDTTGTMSRPNGFALKINSGSANLIGGTNAGDANRIAYNNTGILVAAGLNNSILSNAIYSISGMGIDLNSNGISVNDNGDGDSGANNLQNYPVLTSAIKNQSNVQILGNLNSTANSNFRIEVFASDACNPSGNGDGQRFISYLDVVTNGSGDAAINVSVSASGLYITATATDASGNTSEFSPCQRIISTTTVTNTNDSGAGSLRAAILESNASVAYQDIIDFAIAGSGVKTINLLTPLPQITDPVVINGYSQAGAREGTSSLSPILLIELNGATAGTGALADGLHILSGGSTVKGLAIYNFADDCIEMNTGGGNTIAGNYIGTLANGTTAQGCSAGLYLKNSANNLLGGSTIASRNILAGNGIGIYVNGLSSSNNQIAANYIGLSATGAILPNEEFGVWLQDAPDNLIGGASVSERNVISGNNSSGLVISGSLASSNTVQGNYIGVNVAGNLAYGNRYNGLYLYEANQTLVKDNLISGNGFGDDVYDYPGLAIVYGSQNTLHGNWIGLNSSGTTTASNLNGGIYIEDSSQNIIGGLTSQERNVISGNVGSAIYVYGLDATGNTILGNYIGLFPNGTLANGNSGSGIVLDNAPNNLIGGTASGAGNVIVGNRYQGIWIGNPDATGNLVQGNFIGTLSASSTLDKGNDFYGIVLFGASNNTIGGTDPNARNYIRYNNLSGIGIFSNADANTMQGNTISNNTVHGIVIAEGSDMNTIGGINANEGNIITAQLTGAGVRIETSVSNSILGNSISANALLGIDLFPILGANLNDVNDVDTGSNNRQNFPVLHSATLLGANTIINGSLNSTPNSSFRIEFFANAACDSSPYGEGQSLLGVLNVSTNALGNASFTTTFTSIVGQGYISAIATNSANNSSEFSLCKNSVPAIKPVTAPSLLQPSLALMSNDNQADFAWTSVANATSYEIQIDNNSTFSSPEAGFTGMSLSYTAPTLADGVYYWRVRGLSSAGLGPWSASRNFMIDTTAPLAPAQSLPALNANLTLARPNFTWLAATGANRYRIQVDNNSDFSSPIIDIESATTSYLSTISLPQGSYYWRLKSRDAALNWGNFGTERSFKVNIQTLPANNGFSTDITPAFSWAAWTGATRYQLQVSSQSNFSSTIIQFNTLTASTLSHSSLTVLGNGTYYWRVNIDTGSGFVLSPFYFTLTISPTPAAAPLLTSPTLGLLTNDNTPAFAWAASISTLGQPYSYQIQIDNNSNFSSPEVDATSASTNYTSPVLADGLYYWRLRTLNSVSVGGIYSASRSFTIDTTAPLAPVQSLPALNATVTTARPTFTWLAAAGANRYRIQVDNDSDFSSPIIDIESTTISYLSTLSLPQGSYYWRLKSRDAALNWGAFGTERSFKLNIQTLPANNGFSTDTTPAFSWAAWTGATRYQLQVSSQSNFSSTVIQFNTLNASTLSHSSLTVLGNGTYYWRVNIDTGSGFVISPFYFTVTISPTPAAAPLLTSPTLGLLTNDNTPAFAWAASVSTLGQPYSYQIQIDNNSNFSSPEVDTVTASTNYTSPVLADGLYYWRLRTLNTFSVGGIYSASRSFTIDTTAPLAPVLSLPALNANVTTARPNFTWLAAVGANRYRIQVDNDSDFSSPIIDIESATTSYLSTLSLPQGSYYWRLKSRDAALNWGNFGTERSFKLNIQTLPANNAYSTDTTPAFSWAAWTGATRYQLQVSSQSNFSSTLIQFNTLNASGLTHSSLTVLGYGTYYWRVNIDTGSGFVISPFYSIITITPAAPLAPVLSSPESAFVTNDNSPSLLWNATTTSLGQPFTYQLQVDNNSNFSSAEIDVTISATNFTTAVLPTGTYSWRVRTINSVGYTGAWSLVRTFSIVP